MYVTRFAISSTNFEFQFFAPKVKLTKCNSLSNFTQKISKFPQKLSKLLKQCEISCALKINFNYCPWLKSAIISFNPVRLQKLFRSEKVLIRKTRQLHNAKITAFMFFLLSVILVMIRHRSRHLAVATRGRASRRGTRSSPS